ncbi:hypothetical protein N9N07_03235 [Pseudomonadales bacterium]|nr:hypothetical protein [Pseudomonadales bacterium]MDB4420914.1 hypothetical protein [Pseudomonadales bacterium]MDB4453015.1 hypothetical protein [bacterium]
MQKYFSLLIILATIIGILMHGHGLSAAIDMTALIFVVTMGIAHALGTKAAENKITRFGDGCVRGGWIGFLIGIILIINRDGAAQMDITSIMPAMAVACLTLLYGYILKLLSMQLD